MAPHEATHFLEIQEPRGMIRIPKLIYQRMIDHAQREDPHECCGILGGKGGTVQKSFEITNAERSSVQFRMDSTEELNVFEEMERTSMDIVAIYHSHPHTIPFPSETDVHHVFDPQMPSVIISLKEQEGPVVRAFRIGKEAICLEEIEII